MKRYLLDTDVCSYFIKGTNPVLNRRIIAHDGALCMSVITLAELRFGTKKNGSSRLPVAIDRLTEVVEVLPWLGSAAHHYAALRHALESGGEPIGSMDMLIAAAALDCGATLVTHNLAHFSRVPGLAVIDWSV